MHNCMSIKLTRQLDVADCGAACLKMLAEYYGRHISLMSIKDHIYVSKYGVSLYSIARGAETLGFKTISLKLSLDYLKDNRPLPCIIHVNNEHFVVLYKIKKSLLSGKVSYFIADPAYGKVKLSEDEFMESWLNDKYGVALIINPKDDGPLKKDCFDNGELNSLRTMLGYFKPFKKYLYHIFIGLVGASLISFMLPFLNQLVVDTGISEKNLSFIVVVLIAQIVLLLGQLFINYVRNWIFMHINIRIGINIISDFLTKLMRIPIRFFDAKSQGDIIQRISDHSFIERFLTDGLLNTFFSVFSIVIFSITLAIYGIKYLLIFIAGSILSLIWIWMFNRKRKKINYIRFQRSRESQDSMFEILNGMTEIKLNNNDLQRRWEWEKRQAKLFKLNLLNLKLEQIQNIGNFTLNQLKNTIVVFFAAYSVIEGDMSIGMMMSITYIMGVLNSPIEQLSTFIQTLQDAQISMERLTELQLIPDEYNSSCNNTNTILDDIINIKIDNLSFGYDGVPAHYVLNDISIDIKSGQTIAIVGASGCGKTTLIKILLGYYIPNEGTITINSYSIDNLPLREWRDSVGCVLQEGYIFSDSVLNNIVMRNEIEQERLNYALYVSNSKEFIDKLPFGLNTKIGPSGMNLSAGQKQRILIARAIYKNPKILIFDEATSALDTQNESQITEKLQDYMANKTAIIIAHRLSTVKNADKIYVLDKGRVVESGNHEDLVNLNGIYHNLIQSQLN